MTDTRRIAAWDNSVEKQKPRRIGRGSVDVSSAGLAIEIALFWVLLTALLLLAGLMLATLLLLILTIRIPLLAALLLLAGLLLRVVLLLVLLLIHDDAPLVPHNSTHRSIVSFRT